MYERNAIVLERYFYEIFDFKNSSNLRDNYYNYRKLFECYGILCDAKEKEKICQNEFDIASKEIVKLQKNQEKLYNKSAKFEYSRYIIFCNTTEKTEDIEKHLSKVNEDVQKNNDELKELGEKFVQAVVDYNEKELNLKDAIAAKEKAQEEYDNTYETAKKCYDEITEELLNNAKEFIKSDNKDNRKELQEIFENNGKNEKNSFDPDVISNTISKSFEIYKIEMDIYLAGHDRISKLFEEIENNSVKNDKHTKYYRDSKAKLDFLNSEKEYIIQFLDNERIGAIYDKKAHRKLMLEACKKFVLDFAQIEKLYDIIIKEAAGRSTKKIYKENYNKEYIIDLANASVEPSLDTGKMRQDAIAFMNLNYWRASGMQSVYDTFEEVVTTIYEKDLSEFIPQELKEQEVEEIVESNEPIETIEELPISKTEEAPVEEIRVETKIRYRAVYYSSKIALVNAIYNSLQTEELADTSQLDVEGNLTNIEIEEAKAEDIKSQKELIENTIEDFENVEEISENNDEENIEIAEKENNFDLAKLDEIEDVDVAIEEDDEYVEDEEFDENEEDSILEIYFSDSEQDEKDSKDKISSINNLGKKIGLFQKLVGFNSKKKKEA